MCIRDPENFDEVVMVAEVVQGGKPVRSGADDGDRQGQSRIDRLRSQMELESTD
jgi:hypothetical protein